MPDLRTKRTNKMITTVFKELLTKEKFSKITVNLISEAALINRSTFYTHLKISICY
ncbi:hypothetical protein [Lentilactobacillus kosonis]|uniref:HTH tetR-type domain-containing protein n=1 Tax=Lentilactobacillus kosonis TaxID=2810561 RepID=A0A401FNS9_9LACO|nr:hypothetical protein [Lentilactobacillus kosonis]GAY74032.1 hypothetical protein NBRC111893_2178 [Lentilactobacillus kosonis]